MTILKSGSFFSAAYRALGEGGAFIFDISTEYKFMHVLDGQLYYEDREKVSYFWRNEFLPQNRLMNMELTFFVRKKNGEYTRFDETHIQRCYTEAELKTLLYTAGFKEIETYEDYTKQPVSEQSMRITFCCAQVSCERRSEFNGRWDYSCLAVRRTGRGSGHFMLQACRDGKDFAWYVAVCDSSVRAHISRCAADVFKGEKR